MSGTLFVVATPIGNLEDITLRALRVLGDVDLIAAEDTRRTAKLLTHYAISTPTISFHEHNSRTRVPELVSKMLSGMAIALVSDAGTPGIADPGIALVQACWKNGIAMDPLPGASAPLTAAVASGFPLEPVTIYGFAPARAQDRITWLTEILRVPSTVVFLETTHRIQRTLADLSKTCGTRPICLARELTKVHQQLLRGDAKSVLGELTNTKGEFTVVVGPVEAVKTAAPGPSDEEIYLEFCHTTEPLGGRRAAVASIARHYGISANRVYAAVERMKDEGK